MLFPWESSFPSQQPTYKGPFGRKTTYFSLWRWLKSHRSPRSWRMGPKRQGKGKARVKNYMGLLNTICQRAERAGTGAEPMWVWIPTIKQAHNQILPPEFWLSHSTQVYASASSPLAWDNFNCFTGFKQKLNGMKICIWESLVQRRKLALMTLNYVLGMLYSSSPWVLQTTLENDDGGGGDSSRSCCCIVYSCL